MTDSNIEQCRRGSSFSSSLGIEVTEISTGFAVLKMEVKEELLNFFGFAHGGALFSLADSAFSRACNTHGGQAVAMQANINFLKPAKLGDILTATATEESLTRSTGVYNVRVENQNGEGVALLRGTMFRKTGEKKEAK